MGHTIQLPCRYPPVGIRIGRALGVEDEDAGLLAHAKRPACLFPSLGAQELQQAAEPRSPGLA